MTVFFHDCRFYSKTSLDVSSRREMQLHLSILCALWELEMDLQRACEKYRVLETRRQKHLSSETVFETPTTIPSPTFLTTCRCPRIDDTVLPMCLDLIFVSWSHFCHDPASRLYPLFHHNPTFMSEFLVYLMTPFWGHNCIFTALPHFCITTLPWDHNPISG